jgi:hypothetical protein
LQTSEFPHRYSPSNKPCSSSWIWRNVSDGGGATVKYIYIYLTHNIFVYMHLESHSSRLK